MDAKLISLHQLAHHTGLPMAWLRREAKEKRLPHILAGKRLMFSLEMVVAELAERQKRQMHQIAMFIDEKYLLGDDDPSNENAGRA